MRSCFLDGAFLLGGYGGQRTDKKDLELDRLL